jgi:ADP-ribosylglycohydrolase
MLGAIAGDVIGSVHEGAAPQPKDFPLFVPQSTFTDDTVLTVAVASAIRHDADTLACIAGAIAEAFYGGVPANIEAETLRRLDDALRAETLAFAGAHRVPVNVPPA